MGIARVLTSFGSGIWIADGPQITAMLGFHYPTRMAVIRLASGELVVWSPVLLTDERRAAVDALGAVRHIVSPSKLHDTYLAMWQEAYPEALLYAPPGLAELREDLRIDRLLDDAPVADWGGEISQVMVRGNAIAEEVVFFHAPSGTVLFCDLLQQMPRDWYRGWRRWVAWLDGMIGPEPAVPRKFRWAFRDKAAARAAVGRILGWPARSVVMAHGTPVTSEAPAFLRRAFGWLVR